MTHNTQNNSLEYPGYGVIIKDKYSCESAKPYISVLISSNTTNATEANVICADYFEKTDYESATLLYVSLREIRNNIPDGPSLDNFTVEFNFSSDFF